MIEFISKSYYSWMSTAPVFYLGESFFCSTIKLDLMKRAIEEQFSNVEICFWLSGTEGSHETETYKGRHTSFFPPDKIKSKQVMVCICGLRCQCPCVCVCSAGCKHPCPAFSNTVLVSQSAVVVSKQPERRTATVSRKDPRNKEKQRLMVLM